tara:strand:+ start:1952 stop:2857 length:906 start_codon:yes stop_codon:yes gene_type:complete
MNEVKTIDKNAIERALMDGDLSKLNPDQKLAHYQSVCQTIGLNPLTKPFQYITLNGKLQMYALKGATDQLRKIYKIDCEIANTETKADLYIVQVKVKDKNGRVDEDMGFARIEGLTGDMLGNAMLKAVTKAKRRATLSMCGLGMLDEDEIKAIPAQSKKQEDELNDHIESQLKIITPPTKSTEDAQDAQNELTDEEEYQLALEAERKDIKLESTEQILTDLQKELGFNITEMIIDGARPIDIQGEAKKHIKGFTNMVDMYSARCAEWKENMNPEAFQEIHDFCVDVKSYFMPYIGGKNEEE